MKTLLTALILILAFTTSAQAGKPGITSVTPDPSNRIVAVDTYMHGRGCTYTVLEQLKVYFNARRGDTMSLQVMSDDIVLRTLYSTTLLNNRSYRVHFQSGSFTVPRDRIWSLVWVLEKSKGKNTIVDAAEVFAADCPAL